MLEIWKEWKIRVINNKFCNNCNKAIEKLILHDNMKRNEIHSNIDSQHMCARDLCGFAVAVQTNLLLWLRLEMKKYGRIEGEIFRKTCKAQSQQKTSESFHRQPENILAMAFLCVVLEAFHFFSSFLLLAKERKTLFSSETYIYANLDRSATFTLLNCRLWDEVKDEKKNDYKMSNISRTGKPNSASWSDWKSMQLGHYAL